MYYIIDVEIVLKDGDKDKFISIKKRINSATLTAREAINYVLENTVVELERKTKTGRKLKLKRKLIKLYEKAYTATVNHWKVNRDLEMTRITGNEVV